MDRSAPAGKVFASRPGFDLDDLRREAAESLAAPGFSPDMRWAGSAWANPEPEMVKQVGATTPFLLCRQASVRHHGAGNAPQLLKMIALGVDMFDCVLLTRVARNGLVFTPGRLDQPA